MHKPHSECLSLILNVTNTRGDDMPDDNLSPKHMSSPNQGLSFLTPFGEGKIKDPGNEAAKFQDSPTGSAPFFIHSVSLINK